MAGVKEERKAKITIDQNGFELNRRYKIRSYFQLKESQSPLGIQGNMVDRKKVSSFCEEKSASFTEVGKLWDACGEGGEMGTMEHEVTRNSRRRRWRGESRGARAEE